jgi:hypothetical protein
MARRNGVSLERREPSGSIPAPYYNSAFSARWRTYHDGARRSLAAAALAL